MQLAVPAQFSIYSDLVNTLEVMGVKPTKEQLGVYVRALEPFNDHVRKAAIDAVAMTVNKRPLPADFANLAKQICGVDNESLKRRGVVQFNKLLDLGNDNRSVLCDDWRIVHAVNTGFGSLSMFFNSRDDEVWMQKRFCEAYSSVDFFLEKTVSKEYLLDNNFFPSVSGLRPIVFLGKYDICLQILNHLPNKSEFMIPLSPEQQMHSITMENDHIEISQEQREKNQAYLSDIMTTLMSKGFKFENKSTA